MPSGEKKLKEIVYTKVFYQRNVGLGIDPECHECTSHSTRGNGYIEVCRNGKKMGVHRWVHFQATGESPEIVMHLCDNPICINPMHLRGGSHTENMKDMRVKGRSSRNKGEKNPSCKLTLKEVEEIRKLLNIVGCKMKEVASKFNVSYSLVYGIKHKSKWK